MVSFIFTGFMKRPVLIEIITGTKCPQTYYSFGSSEPPFCTCHLHAIFYQMSTCTLYNPCGYRKPLKKVTVIMEVRRLVEQISCASIHWLSCLFGEFLQCGATAHPSCHLTGFSLKDSEKAMAALTELVEADFGGV